MFVEVTFESVVEKTRPPLIDGMVLPEPYGSVFWPRMDFFARIKEDIGAENWNAFRHVMNDQALAG